MSVGHYDFLFDRFVGLLGLTESLSFGCGFVIFVLGLLRLMF